MIVIPVGYCGTFVVVKMMSSQAQYASSDSFELYDLRVEVICPPGERIMCGAKDGDAFTLQGELLYLPPGQGFSIYSLGMFGPFIPA